MSKKMLLIVNPVSGRKTIRSSLLDILNLFEAEGYEVTVSVTQRRGYATEIANAHANDYDRVVCCGGDGTLNEVVHGITIAGSQTPIGYIPSGSTNDFANCVGLSSDPLQAAENIAHGEVHPLDVGCFNDSHFSYVASFGAFSSTSYSVPQSTKNVLGHLAYIFGGIADVTKITSTHAVCQTPDGNTFEGDFVFGGVMNSNSIGGVVKLKKDLIDMSDGQFEVILVRMPKNPAELGRIASALLASDFNDPLFHFFKASEVSFTFDAEIPWSLDGEYRNGGTQVTVRNLHEGLRLIH